MGRAWRVVTCVVAAASLGAGAPSDDVVEGACGRALDAYLLSEKNFPGGFSGAVLVAKDGAIVLEKGYGVADAAKQRPLTGDAICGWASVTKQFTAAAVLKLAMQKKLALDDPLTRHWKDAPKDKAKVTIRQLLSHTSGLPDRVDVDKVNPYDRDAVVKLILAAPLVGEPGRRMQYNNVGYLLAAALIEVVSGQSYETFVRENLFVPAGMKDAGFIGDGRTDAERVPLDARGTGTKWKYGPALSWGVRGADGLLATVHDLHAWDQALRGDKILSKAAKRDYFEPGLSDYALGVWVKRGTGGIHLIHDGSSGGLRAGYLRVLDDPLVVAVSCNYVPEVEMKPLLEKLAEVARNAR
jgi:CubicO group peptidase (beta-lactamase class C family)